MEGEIDDYEANCKKVILENSSKTINKFKEGLPA